jgi:hypothetical protein
MFVNGSDTVFPEHLFPFGGGKSIFQYSFVAVEGNHLAGFFFECHLLQEVFNAGIECCGRVFIYIFDTQRKL